MNDTKVHGLPQTIREYRLPELTGIDCLTLYEDAPILMPGPGEVLVKIHAVSLQQRDLMVAKGNYPVQLSNNLVPCSDMAGEIVALGPNVKSSSFTVGTRVCANFSMPDFVFGDLGAHTGGVLVEYKVFEADPDRLIRIPDYLTYEEASTLPCAGLTAYTALNGPVPVKAGDTVLVQGTSGVSIFVLQFALALSANVIITSSSSSKLDITRNIAKSKNGSSGVDKSNVVHGVNYRTKPEWDKEVIELTGGRGADLVVDIGGASTLLKSMNAAAVGGWIQLVGIIGHESADLNSLPLLVMAKQLCLRGVTMGGAENFRSLMHFLATTAENSSSSSLAPVPIHPYIDRVFAFEDAREAYKYMDGRGHVGKVVIKVAKG